jgi:hypothetical protein
MRIQILHTRIEKRAWTTFDANHIKEIIVELYSSLDDTSKSLATYYTYMGFIAKMRTWLFSKTARYFAKPMTARERVCFKAGKGYERRQD